jgi:hypothetical protein
MMCEICLLVFGLGHGFGNIWVAIKTKVLIQYNMHKDREIWEWYRKLDIRPLTKAVEITLKEFSK